MIEYQFEIYIAANGREYWLNLKNKYKLKKNDCVIILPTSNCELNYIAISNIPLYINNRYLDQTIIVKQNDVSIDFSEIEGVNNIYIENISENVMNSLIGYCKLTKFFDNIIIISDKEPFGNLNLVGKHLISLEEYVRGAIYNVTNRRKY